MTIVDTAMEIALTYHHGVTNEKDGEPYILHVMRVARSVREAGLSEIHQAIAWLHDVIEDTDLTIAQLRTLLMDAGHDVSDILAVLRGVVAITKVKGQSQDEYLAIVMADPYAPKVKLEDTLDNFGRNHKIEDEATRLRLAKKYSKNIEVLRRVP